MADEAASLAGRLTPEGHSLSVRVYFEDTDFSGAVYHASYLRFLERGRSDFLRLLGVSHRALAAENMAFAVRTMNLSFDRVARIDDLVEIRTKVAEITGARISLRQRVVRDDETIVSAEVTVVLVDTSGRPKRIPASIRQLLGARIDGAS